MNVLIITEEDVLYVYEFFKSFFPLTKNALYRICGISILAPFNKKSHYALAKQMLGFYGLLSFLRVGTVYSYKKITRKTIASLAQAYRIPHIETDNINAAEYIEQIKELKIDIIVSIAAPQKFGKALLTAAPLGCINSHSSLLPENRGMMPVFWGLYKGAPQIGVTIHYMSEKLDQGDIIQQVSVAVHDESLHEMILHTKQLSARLIDETLHNIMSGIVRSTPMPPGGSYQTFPTPAEVAEFKRRGKRIF